MASGVNNSIWSILYLLTFTKKKCVPKKREGIFVLILDQISFIKKCLTSWAPEMAYNVALTTKNLSKNTSTPIK